MARVLVTSALPYINGIKHLGNVAGSLLPADIYHRFRRQLGDDVLFICATDEHGTPAELAASAAGMDVAEYCREQHDAQRQTYAGLNLAFNHFGRSSSKQNREMTQHFYKVLDRNGFIEEREIDQIYSVIDGRFLPDRYVTGTCPHCGYPDARGDQCENCTRMLDPIDLIEPRSAISGSTELELRPSRHLFFRQSALEDDLRAWIKTRKQWPTLVHSIAQKWLNEGIQDRGITRDLTWGVPVPKEGFDGKVFYVWFDAPIEYIAATKEWAGLDPTRDWKSWWYDASDVEYFQFLGKDNVPFHAVMFPMTLLGSQEPWKTVDMIKGVNWLTYAGGKFSTSQRRGIFLDQALELLPADYWRWWLASNLPETSDTDFSFRRFATDVNNDLADTFGNLVNRVVSFALRRFEGHVPVGGQSSEAEAELARELDELLQTLHTDFLACHFRRTADGVRAVWRLANGYIAAQAPWSHMDSNPERAAVIIRTGLNLVHCAATIAWPFIPTASQQVLSVFGERPGCPTWPQSAQEALARVEAGRPLQPCPVLFAKLTPEWVDEQTDRFAGASAAEVTTSLLAKGS